MIDLLPFYVVSETDMDQATIEVTDPDPPCRPVGSYPASQSLWYSYTTGSSTEYVTLTMTNHSIVGIMAVYTGVPGAFRIVSGSCSAACRTTTTSRASRVCVLPRTRPIRSKLPRRFQSTTAICLTFP